MKAFLAVYVRRIPPYRMPEEAPLGERFVRIIATGLGSGYAPFAPGTAGTLVAIPVYLVLFPLSWPLYLLTVVALTFLAIHVSGSAEVLFGRKDAPRIVIDEICGFLFAMFCVTPTVVHIAAGFAFFRLFDIVKPFPAGLIQRRLPGGYGVVLDDVAAGIYANLVLQGLVWAGILG